MKIDMFPQELIDLNRELANHESAQIYLAERLGARDQHDIYMKLSILATYVGILVEGSFDQQATLKLARMITEKLRSKNVIIVSTANDVILPGINSPLN